jgi:outer membrane autotransporter protein
MRGLTLSALVVRLADAQLTAIPGQNVAQQTMSGSIDKFCPSVSQTAVTPDQIDLKTICSAMIGNALQLQGQQPGTLGSYGLSASGLQDALQSLNGGAELLVPTSQASVVQTTETSRQTDTIEDRLKKLRGGASATSVPSAAAAPGEQLASLSTPGAGGQILLAQNQTPPFSYSLGPLGVFINGLGQFGSRGQTTSENGYSFNNAGFVAGADLGVNPQVIAGMAFGYTQSNTAFDTSFLSAPGQSLYGNLLQGNVYATYFPTDAFYINAIGIIGGGNNDSLRHIVIPSANPSTLPVDRIASGSFGSRIGGFTVSGGYNLPAGAIILTPIARFLYQHTGVNAFSEQGAMGANLQYGSSEVNSVLTFLGADAQYTMNTSLGVLYPIARFRWAHQYTPGNTSVSVAYSNDNSPNLLSSFILPGTPTSRNYFDLGLGISLQLTANKWAFIDYDSILGISHTSFNSFIAGIRVMF